MPLLKTIKNNILYFVVFITGACVLILEVLATRVLSPFFGNTIYTISSVLGVMLGGLSLGYYFGGKKADKTPSYEIFYSIIFSSAICVLVTHIISYLLLPVMGYSLSIKPGSIIASLVLFLAPSFYLGLLSPFAIKLAVTASKQTKIGEISGIIFFCSTAGSIVGSFAAGFFLIPSFGIKSILIGVSLTLFIIGLLGRVVYSEHGLKKIIVGVAVYIILLVSDFVLEFKPPVVYSKDGIYEKITVVDTKYQEKDVRMLSLDISSSSGIYKGNTDLLLFDYTKYVDLYKLAGEKPQKFLFLGGGAYSMPAYVKKNVPNSEVDVAEIEPDLLMIAQKYFEVPEDLEINSRVTDGRRMLHDSSKLYDVIFSDVYSSIYSIPAQFTSKEFFELSKDKLSPNGIFIANIIGEITRIEPSLLLSEIKTFKSVYPNSYYFAVDGNLAIGGQNIIFLGLKNDKELDFKSIATKHKDNQILSNLEKHLIDLERFDFRGSYTLTDDYSPTDYLSSLLIKNLNKKENYFSGEEALSLVKQIVNIGTRNIGTDGEKKITDLIERETRIFAKSVTKDTWKESVAGKELTLSNIVASVGDLSEDRILIGTHFDSLKDNPGANNSASGVAVLLELMRVLKSYEIHNPVNVDFVFFDGEEGYPGEKWTPYGSTHFVSKINDFYPKNKPKMTLIIDMVCDKNLNFYYEKNSLDKAPQETKRFFDVARSLYTKNFNDEVRHAIDDDHTAFNTIGIPAVLLIDFDYPHYNKPTDTPDKCSSESLQKVGDSILKYIYSL